MEIRYIPEPELIFGYNQKNIDPRDGLSLFGAYTNNQEFNPIIGLIGTLKQIKITKEWLKKIIKPIINDKNDLYRPTFPGIESIFNMKLSVDNFPEIIIDKELIQNSLSYNDSFIRTYKLVDEFVKSLLKYQNEEEVPVVVWIVAIEDEIYQFCRPKSILPKIFRKNYLTVSKKYRNSDSLFEEVNQDIDAYDYYNDFHHQLKNRLLEYKIVTQVIRNRTINYSGLNNTKLIESEQKLESAKAWALATTLYYKIGGTPWVLDGIRDEVCYIGLVYKKLKNNKQSAFSCCAAQMFLNDGNGIVFKGNIGKWYNKITKEYHLDKNNAKDLIERGLKTFEERHKKLPKEVFIHARTHFNDDEWSGFCEASKNIEKIIGITIQTNDKIKLYRNGNFAYQRGTVLKIDEKQALLCTKGFIPKFENQLGNEIPNPIHVKISRGESDIITVCKDILSLTKLNYNTCIYGDGIPVTLRFSDNIGDVLTAGIEKKIEVLTFKNYI